MGVRKGKNLLQYFSTCMLFKNLQELYQCHFVQITLVTPPLTLPLGGDTKMHGEAAYCLSLAYHFSGDHETALAVSLFFTLAFSMPSSTPSACLAFAEWKKQWKGPGSWTLHNFI